MRRIVFISLIFAAVAAIPGSGQVPVTVYEDEGGVPHVVGASDAAVLWALGRQHMLDFPVSTAFHLWYASGQLATRLGIDPNVNEYWLDVDVSHLLWRIPERVAQSHRPRVQADPVLGPLLELGHIKALDLTPPGAASGLGAVFPLGGSKDSLYQTGSWDLAASLDETYVGGQIASAVVADRTAVGTTRLMVIEFTASGPEVSYLAPVGMTEIATDPRRYLPAQDFADRQVRPLHFDVATIMSPIHAIRVTPLVMPP